MARLKLFHLGRKDPESVPYDETVQFVVAASDWMEARELAMEYLIRGEQRDFWHSDNAVITQLGTADADIKRGVIVHHVNYG